MQANTYISASAQHVFKVFFDELAEHAWRVFFRALYFGVQKVHTYTWVSETSGAADEAGRDEWVRAAAERVVGVSIKSPVGRSATKCRIGADAIL